MKRSLRYLQAGALQVVAALVLGSAFAVRAQDLTVTARLVQVPVQVLDSTGKPLELVSLRRFAVYDDGVEQNIAHIWTDSEAPLNVGFVLDVSGTQLPHLLENRALLTQFLQSVLHPGDHVFLETFDAQARLVAESTGTADPVLAALQRFSRERADHPHWIGTPMPLVCQGKQRIAGAPCGNSVVWNAVANAAEHLRQQEGRRALVLVTDGEDTGSETSLEGAIGAAQDAATAVFALGLPDPYHHRLNRRGLQQLANGTGGSAFLDQTDAGPIFAALDRELRAEYVVAYKPPASHTPGKVHTVTVRVEGAATVQFKRGYTESP